MQALTPTLFPCYAEADREIANEIANFLDRGADVRVFLEEGCMAAGEDLAAKAREGRMADAVLVLFSRRSLPSRWARSQWEAALVHEPAAEGVRIAFARCDDCVPPRVLMPCFDLRGRRLSGMRELKRWVRHRAVTWVPPQEPRCPDREADVEVLAILLADRAGTETVESLALALEFGRECREDFDEILMTDASGRSLAAAAGDLAAQLGLRLEGDLESNLERLRDFCRDRRFLVIVAGVDGFDAAELSFGGRCSTAIVPDGGIAVSGDSLAAIQRALNRPSRQMPWEEVCDLVRQGRRLSTAEGRLAECYELMRQWHATAELRGDRRVLDESAREMVWILESWGRTEEAFQLDRRRALEFDEQMSLF